MTNRAFLPEALEDDLLPEGVSHAANAICEMDDISDKLKAHVMSFQVGTLANGKGLYFSEVQAEKVLQKLMDAVLEIATASDDAEGSPDDADEEAAAADGGAADPEPFLGANLDKESLSERATDTISSSDQSYRPLDLHLKRIKARGESVRPEPSNRDFNPLDDLRDIEITYALVAGERVSISTPHDLLNQVVYAFCTRISSTAREDVRALKQYAGLTAINKKKPHLKGHLYDPKTGLTLPKLPCDELLRSVFRMARAASIAIEVGVTKAAHAPVMGERFSYTYDPEKLHEPKHESAKEEAVCGPGMIFRFRYRDTQDIRSYYIAKSADDDRVMTNGTERIANGSPLARAVEGFGVGDTADVVIASDERPVQILDVWDPAASDAVIELN
jgi:hypothetical protein